MLYEIIAAVLLPRGNIFPHTPILLSFTVTSTVQQPCELSNYIPEYSVQVSCPQHTVQSQVAGGTQVVGSPL